MQKGVKKVTYDEVKLHYDYISGELIEETKRKTILVDKEPDFCKMYLDDLQRLFSLQNNTQKVLLCLLQNMGYNNRVITVKELKEQIAKDTGLSYQTVVNSINKLKDTGFLIRQSVNVYVVDPNLFARGNWKDIQNLKLTIVYNPDGTRSIRSNVMEEMIKQGLRE